MNLASEIAVCTESLGKRFRRVVALASINLNVVGGDIFALIGPNGAGKTTLLKVLLNLLPPSRGQARVLGVDSRRIGPQFFQRVGYVSESQALPKRVSAAALFRYLRRLYDGWDAALVTRLASQLELPTDVRIGQLSRGGQAKLRVICAIAHRPELLVLDEMFTGLDPLVRDQLMEGVLEMAADSGWTVLLSSHEMSEVERLAESVAFLDRGHITFSGSMAEVLDRHRLVEIECDRPLPDNTPPPHWIERRLDQRHIRIVDTRFDPTDIEQRLEGRYGPHGQCRISPMPLRDIFVVWAQQHRQGLST